MIEHIVDTPLGWFKITGNEQAITGSTWIQEEDAIVGSSGVHIEWKRHAEIQIQEYFLGERANFQLPLTPAGSTFQTNVWLSLLNIDRGQKRTYGELAADFGGAEKARAIGQAIGSNPCLLLIPCHRVIGSDGSITGYAGGIERKEWLLKHEGADLPEQLSLFDQQ